eukprot:CAMPEP_0182418884 /NCGR_PEP_ID=MMETSP1167-20130531/3264_1 /TAXON_ID=2988 /ORGANISM="Mallomonas Sp, Strain CCMP3275" /LENGTH=541 /DNA_ID=CAMNT_0024593345 /DNA_START=59 /DNA_END=1681 /DNA_ORIENTATION=-
MPSTLQTVLQGLLQGLKDPCLPTQTAAACALRVLVSAEGAKSLLQPAVKEIVKEYFRIMAAVENDAVMSALQVIVTEYGEEIVEIAPAIASQLLAAFQHYASAGEEDDESLFTASQCLETVCTVLEVSKENTPVMQQLEVIVTPVVAGFFSERDDAMEFIDCAVTMLGYLTFYLDNINPNMWQIFPSMILAMETWAFDYMQEITTPVLNFISKDTDTFLQGHYNGISFLDMVSGLIRKALDENRDDDEREAKAAAKLLCGVVSCCRGRIDRFVPYVFQLVAMRLSDAHTSGLTTRLLEVAMAAIYYDPFLATEIFRGDPDATDTLFKKLFDKLPSMTRGSSQRLVVLSFSSLFTLPSSSLPTIVVTNLQPMLAQMIREVVMLEAEEGEEEDEEGEEAEGDEDGDDDDEEEEEEQLKPMETRSGRSKRIEVPEDGYDEEDDCLNVEDEEYRAVLEAAENSTTVKRTLYSGGFPVGEDEDEEEDEEDEEEFTSPLDNLDVSQCLCAAVRSMERREPELVMRLKSGLDEEDKTRLSGLLDQTLV